MGIPLTLSPTPLSSVLTCLQVGGVVSVQGQGGGDDGGVGGGATVDAAQHPPIIHI